MIMLTNVDVTCHVFKHYSHISKSSLVVLCDIIIVTETFLMIGCIHIIIMHMQLQKVTRNVKI